MRAATIAVVLVIASATGADAAVPEGNLLTNPSAEEGPPGLPGWTVEGSLTAFPYDSPGDPGGAYFFAGGDGGDSLTRAFQTIDVAQAAEEIDACRVNATFAGNFGGRDAQEDRAGADVTFFDKGGGVLDTSQIGYPTAANRNNTTGLLSYSSSRTVPFGTRTIKFTVIAQRAGDGYNDGFADNLSLSLAKLEPSPGAAPIPTPGQTVVVRVTRGTATFRYNVVIHLAGGPCSISPEDYQRLLDQIAVILAGKPVIDARKGEVELKAADGAGGTQTGLFSRGVFQVAQTGAAKPITELTMQGGNFARKCKAGQASAARRRVVRQLFGNAHGRFRTRGRNSSATIRGTRWLVKETCAGTLTTSLKGTVVVRDLIKNRTRTLRTGQSYLARPRN